MLNRFLAWLDNFLEDWTLYYFSLWSDRMQAGKRPAKFDYQLHHSLARLAITLGIVRRDCLFIDISRWQLDVDFVKMRNHLVQGVILKCGQGLGIDRYFKTNWQKAKAAGLFRGCYWYFDSRVEPKRQAQLWADTLKEVGFGELPCWLDYEEDYGGEWAGIVNLAEFLREFQRLTGLPNDMIGIYTGYFYWFDFGSGDSFWAQYWLWLAWYGDEEDVIIPRPWSEEKVWGWQFSASGDGYFFGVSSKDCDLNWFIKGLPTYEAMYGDTGEFPELPTGVEGMYRVVSSSYRMTFRKTPTASGEVINRYDIGTVFVADRIDIPPVSGGLPTDKWAHVVSINGVAVDGYVAQVHLGVLYCTATPIPDNEANPSAEVRFVDPQGRAWSGSVELHPE